MSLVPLKNFALPSELSTVSKVREGMLRQVVRFLPIYLYCQLIGCACTGVMHSAGGCPQSFRSVADSVHFISDYLKCTEHSRGAPCWKIHLRQPEVMRNITSLSFGFFFYFNKTLNQIILRIFRFTPRQPTSVRQKSFEIRQKLAYIASFTPKIFGVTYKLSSMAWRKHFQGRFSFFRSIFDHNTLQDISLAKRKYAQECLSGKWVLKS